MREAARNVALVVYKPPMSVQVFAGDAGGAVEKGADNWPFRGGGGTNRWPSCAMDVIA